MAILHSRQPIDALFTDIHLKTAALGGFEVAILAIALRPGLRVLCTTGNFTDKMKAQLVEGTHFLSKPYTENRLERSVKTMLE